ncbi:hypothetical protein EV401DRAFT_1891919 [Pisolithus croceorrhizus]|nr:hypothetical protein EV401DRAFT_1891919 [Pisolithus croceorrhizus]
MPEEIVNGAGQSRPRRVPAPSSRITCADNAAELALPSHRQAQAATRTIQIITKRKATTSTGNDRDVSDFCLQDDTLTPSYSHSSVPDDISLEPTCTGPDGLLQDIRVVDLDETEGPPKQRRVERSQDIDAFFSPAFMREGKKYRHCTACSQAECKQVSFVNEVSTLRHHMQAVHKKIPNDAEWKQPQVPSSSLDDHLVPRDQVPLYSESAFRDVSIQWLIETDQNPVFQKMINLASQRKSQCQNPDPQTDMAIDHRSFQVQPS